MCQPVLAAACQENAALEIFFYFSKINVVIIMVDQQSQEQKFTTSEGLDKLLLAVSSSKNHSMLYSFPEIIKFSYLTKTLTPLRIFFLKEKEKKKIITNTN